MTGEVRDWKGNRRKPKPEGRPQPPTPTLHPLSHLQPCRPPCFGITVGYGNPPVARRGSCDARVRVSRPSLKSAQASGLSSKRVTVTADSPAPDLESATGIMMAFVSPAGRLRLSQPRFCHRARESSSWVTSPESGLAKLYGVA